MFSMMSKFYKNKNLSLFEKKCRLFFIYINILELIKTVFFLFSFSKKKRIIYVLIIDI
jgi:hypothetical protein